MSRPLPSARAAARLTAQTGLNVTVQDIHAFAVAHPDLLPDAAPDQPGLYALDDLDRVAADHRDKLSAIVHARVARARQEHAARAAAVPPPAATSSRGGGCSHRKYQAGMGMGRCPSCSRRMTQYGR